MTKDYHLTQEQAEAIAKDVESKSLTPLALVRIASPRELQALANAALDKVLGEPVAEVRMRNAEWFGYITLNSVAKHKLECGDKLYAPKGLT